MHSIPTLFKNNKGFSAVKLLLALFAIAVVGAIVYGAYMWQQWQVVDLNSQIADLKNQVEQLRQKDNNTDSQIETVEISYTSAKGASIEVFTPKKGDTVSDTLIVMGRVPGNWSFEASFPIKLVDTNGKVIAETNATLLDDWMTEDLVGFTAKLSIPGGAVKNGTTGKLFLEKDNPSGAEANDDSVTVDVKF